VSTHRKDVGLHPESVEIVADRAQALPVGPVVEVKTHVTIKRVK